MLEHRYDIRISESYVDPNPLMVEIQDPDNFTRFQTRERCALEIAAYVFKDTKYLLINNLHTFVNERNFNKMSFMVALKIDIRTKEMLNITPCQKCCFV